MKDSFTPMGRGFAGCEFVLGVWAVDAAPLSSFPIALPPEVVRNSASGGLLPFASVLPRSVKEESKGEYKRV